MKLFLESKNKKAEVIKSWTSSTNTSYFSGPKICGKKVVGNMFKNDSENLKMEVQIEEYKL
jgi:hypothetical protein